MTNNKLKCVLAYHVSAVSGVGKAKDDDTVVTTTSFSSNNDSCATLLAAYDHASQYETRGGTMRHTSLFGGRDKAYAEAATMVISENPPLSDCESGVLGCFKVVNSNNHKIVYGSDANGLCLVVITGLNYPTRVAIKMLTELYSPYSEKFGEKAKSATFNSLNKKSRPLLSSYCERYDDATKVEKTHEVAMKVEEVKETMHKNIADILKNTEHIESLVDRSENLNDLATVFKKNTKTLRKTMRCKNIKYNIVLSLLVVGVLAAALVPLILKYTKENE